MDSVLRDNITNYEHVRYDTHQGIEVIWALVSTAFIFFMQAGFALVETGCVRQKNAQSILIKNVFDSAVGCVGFYLIGYAFAFGNVNYFIGYGPKYFAASGFSELAFDNYKWWIFQYSFAATSATIVSGSLAERCQLTTYVCFSFFMTSFIYPVVVAWVWAVQIQDDGTQTGWGTGWLKNLGYVDFAGSSVVHVVGGICALWGAKILGPRYGKEKEVERQRIKKLKMTEIDETASNASVLFNDEEFHKVLDHVRGDYRLAFQEWITAQRKQEFKPHNPGLILAGTILLWVCWLFFNGGSAVIFSQRKNGAAKVIMNNLIAPASAALFAAFFKARITGTYSYVEQFDVGTICNGIIVGLVASTASCDGTEPWASVIIGCVAALIYSIGVLLINKFGIDDPLEASPVHLGGGAWGTLVVGLFNQDKGLFYNPSEGIKLLGVQALGLVSIIIWVSFWSILLFSTLNRLNLFRVSKEIEIMGLDIAEMGGVNEEIYSKLRTDFGVMSPSMSPTQSNITPLQQQRGQRLLSLDNIAKQKLLNLEREQKEAEEELLPKFGHEKGE